MLIDATSFSFAGQAKMPQKLRICPPKSEQRSRKVKGKSGTATARLFIEQTEK